MRVLSVVLLSVLVASPILAQQDPDIERGFKPGQSYETAANIDVTNLFNGTVNLTIPLKNYTVGGSLEYGFALHGATNSWDVGYHEVDRGEFIEPIEYKYTYPWKHGQSGLGWILSLGKIYTIPGSTFYIGPDGTQHAFFLTLHPGETPQNNVRYTRDGSYLRLKTFPNEHEVHFPNGHTHTFDAAGRLTRMQDPFGNQVNVNPTTPQGSSDPFPGSTKWTITDSVGRTHRVYFRPGPGYVEDEFGVSVAHELVHRVDLAAFSGGTAQYEFAYEDETTGFSNVSRRCTVKPDPDMQVVNAPLLTSVTLGGYLQYSFDYDKGDGIHCSNVLTEDGSSGNLTKVTLPTGGSIEWTFRKYTFPGTGDGQFGNAGAKTRTVKNHDGVLLAETTYLPETIPTSSIYYDVVRTVSEKDAAFKTKHYFGACRAFTPLSCQTAGYYGLSVTTSQSSGGAYLSTEVLENQSGTWVTVRKTYRKYEADVHLDAGVPQDQLNQRLSFEKTVYEDNSWTSTAFSDFDGLGHYRYGTTTGSWGKQDSRTTFTNFNPNSGSYNFVNGQLVSTFTLPTGTWLLATFDKETVTQSNDETAAVTSESSTCFDSLGFLTSRRTYKNFGASPTATTNDLLARFTRDSSGNLTKEQYVGGDSGVLAPASWTCGSTLASETYRIDHAYQHGVRARSYYHDGSSPLSFFLMDRTIDQNTGLPTVARQMSTPTQSGASNGDGLARNYEFDLLGRLTDVLPQGTNRRAKTKYVYTMNPPSVTVSQIDGTTTLRSSTSNFDSLGRLRSESRTMPVGTASRSVDYDVLGRKSSERSWGLTASTTFTYDIFGRPKTITAPSDTTTPGGTTTSFTYTAASKVERTADVRTGSPSASPQFTSATTTEEYDPLGRLWRVTEPPPSVAGTRPVTEYEFDVGGRLIEVCSNKSGSTCAQTRAFSYDNRGFLTSETHPEKAATGNGTTHIAEYDARGHAGRRYEGTATSVDVGFEYDRAERLTRVEDRVADRTLKSFSFASANSGTDLRNGRLQQAVGYNWLSVGLAVKVIEDYKYEHPDGLVSKRTTSDIVCNFNTENCETVTVGTKEREFEQTFSYDKLSLPTSLGYPDCTANTADGCASSTAARTVTNAYTGGWLTGVTWNGAAASSAITYHAQGTVEQITHGNGVIDTQTVDLGGRLKSLTTENALEESTCLDPSFITQPEPQTITGSGSATLTAEAAGESGSPITYQWYRGLPSDTSTPEGQPSATGTIQVTPSVTTTYWVQASNTCPAPSTANSVAATVTVCSQPSITTQPASETITQGQAVTLQVAASGSTPKTYQWYTVVNNVASPINGATSSTLNVTPAATKIYRAKVTNDCGNEDSANATITVEAPPTPPANVSAVKEGNSIRITWSPSESQPGIAYYRVVRSPDNHYSSATVPTTYLDSTGLVAGNAYTYRVIAYDINGIASGWSAFDLATLLSFDDDPLVAGQTPIKGIHIGQLRQAIDAVREAANLAAAWQSYAAATGPVLAWHFTEMRDKLNEARVQLQLQPVEFTDPVSIGSTILATQLQTLRGGVQ